MNGNYFILSSRRCFTSLRRQRGSIATDTMATLFIGPLIYCCRRLNNLRNAPLTNFCGVESTPSRTPSCCRRFGKPKRSVAIPPGQATVTDIPSSASSMFSARENTLIYAFVELYIAMPGIGIQHDIDDMLRMYPFLTSSLKFC